MPGFFICSGVHSADRSRCMNHQTLSSFIWSVAELLRGDYKQSEYGRVILPFTVLRRLDCVLEATKPKVLLGPAQLYEALRARHAPPGGLIA